MALYPLYSISFLAFWPICETFFLTVSQNDDVVLLFRETRFAETRLPKRAILRNAKQAKRPLLFRKIYFVKNPNTETIYPQRGTTSLKFSYLQFLV
jgi:hypothetical protein